MTTKCCCLRVEDSHWKPLHWDFPGGHLKDDENWEEGAIREVKEETNLDISDLKEISYKNQPKRVKFFKTTNFSGKIAVDKAENKEHKWVKAEELSNYDKLTPNVTRFVEREL